jgi:hypothetical protein
MAVKARPVAAPQLMRSNTCRCAEVSRARPFGSQAASEARVWPSRDSNGPRVAGLGERDARQLHVPRTAHPLCQRPRGLDLKKPVVRL